MDEQQELAETKGDTAETGPEPGSVVPSPVVPGPVVPGNDRWAPVAALPTPIMVAVPIPEFRLRDLLALRPGSLVASAWRGGREVPLAAGRVEFAWAEFEVADQTLSARITRLAGE